MLNEAKNLNHTCYSWRQFPSEKMHGHHVRPGDLNELI